MAIPKKLEELTEEITEWSKEFFGDLNPVSGTPLLVFTAKELRAAEARAEAAEKQLAEKGDLIDSYSNAAHTQSLELDATRQHLIKAQGRIAELERLVPDADVLAEVVEEATLWELGLPYGSDDTHVTGEMRRLVAAIRKYRKCDDDTNGH